MPRLSGRPRALITDPGERSVLAATRGLHARGYDVLTAGSGDRLAATRWSRSCSGFFAVADPRVDAVQFVSDLDSVLAAHPCEVLIPGTDFSLLALSDGRERLERRVSLGLPPPNAVQASFSRDALAAAAARAGLSPITSIRCADAAAAEQVAATVGFPAIVKSATVVEPVANRIRRGITTRRVNTPAELSAHVAGVNGAFVIQPVVAGEAYSFGGVFAADRLLSSCLSRYERTWPPDAGNVAYSITVAKAPELEQSVTRLCQELGWEGIFELELIRTESGAFVPIDFNPRLYGSLALAIASGANLPALWCDWLRGIETERRDAQSGRYYRWEEADLRHLLWQVRQRRFRDAVRVTRPRRRVVHPYFRRSDPLPLLARTVQLARRARR